MKTTESHHQDIIAVNEEFVALDTRLMDSKHRITLGGKLMKTISRRVKKIDSYQVLVSKNGDVLLRPAVSIPAREVWIYENPKVIDAIRTGLKDAKEGKITRVKNQEKFFENL